ncbi:hypothetical protein [Scandinavium goeteborgense]|uniref:Uncharacterized protein n=1 Tax=Scandinavium goeteborgense TaxID=1851514 RepID=A0A4R6EN62_SCAGO|nr:hypothetical protein [Scandinavium goeteborgense]TDN60660.1 hypothetical protein EC847_102237 [Scandinavium goeteborgense]
MITALKENANFNVPALKDDKLSSINTYDVMKFHSNYRDESAIARIIEIHFLNKLRVKGEKLSVLTGLKTPETATDAQEINLLLSRYVQLCRKEEEELSFLQREASNAEAVLTGISTSMGSSSIAEAKSKSSSRSIRAEATHRYDMALARLQKHKDRLSMLKRLPGLLADEAELIGKGIDRRVLNSFPASSRIPNGFLSVFQVAQTKSFIQAVLDQLDRLTTAVDYIVKNCTFPTDKHQLIHCGVEKTQAYRDYYQVGNEFLPAIMTAREYVDYIVKNNSFTELKKKYFS